MKADAIIEKILDDARASAEQVLSEARARAAQMKREAEGLAEKRREEAMANARLESASIREHMLRMAELDQRKAELSVKRGLIDRAFSRAYEKLFAMPDAEKIAYYTDLIASNAQGDESIVVSMSDARLFTEDALGAINERLRTSGKTGRVSLDDEKRELGGGLILKKGGMEVNCTFHAIINEIRPSLESTVAHMLIGDVR